MAMSGVTVDEEVKAAHDEMKSKKTTKYIILKFTDDLKKIVIDQTSCEGESFKDFRQKLPEKGCRYVFTDWLGKMCLIKWCPDSAKIKDKMLAASSFDAVKLACDHSSTMIAACDMGDLEDNEITSQCEKFKRN